MDIHIHTNRQGILVNQNENLIILALRLSWSVPERNMSSIYFAIVIADALIPSSINRNVRKNNIFYN